MTLAAIIERLEVWYRERLTDGLTVRQIAALEAILADLRALETAE